MKHLYLINLHNPLVSLVDSKQNRWNRDTVWIAARMTNTIFPLASSMRRTSEQNDE